MEIDSRLKTKIVISLGVALSAKVYIFSSFIYLEKRFDYKFDAYLSFPLKESQV